MDKVKVYMRSDGKFDWRRRSENGRIVATSGGQGYESRSEAKRMAVETNGGEWEFDADPEES